MNKVGILIVWYNDLNHLPILCRSLKQQIFKEYIIYSLDNNPEIDHTSALLLEFPEAICFKTNENSGYAAGNNLLAAKAIADGCNYVLVLNPDMELHVSCLYELINLAESSCNFCILGPVVLYGNERKCESLIQVYGVKANLKTQYKKALFAGCSLNDLTIPDKLEVTYSNGGCLLIRSNVVLNVGLFEERFFMYNDEMDFAFRTYKAGYKTIVTKKAIAWHHHDWNGRSNKSVCKMYYYIMRNRYLYFIIHKFYLFMAYDLAKEIFLCLIRISWLVRIGHFHIVGFYYRGIVDGLLFRQGKALKITR